MSANGTIPGLYLARRTDQRRPDIPLSEKVVGFFSDPGIVPCEDDEDGVISSENQDRAFVAMPLYPEVPDCEWLACGVCDGLGIDGCTIADYVVEQVVECLRSDPGRFEAPMDALNKAVLAADAALAHDGAVKLAAVSSGSTCLVALLFRYHLFVAQCGDSAAVVGRRYRAKGAAAAKKKQPTKAAAKGGDAAPTAIPPPPPIAEARKLTREHTPSDPQEKHRCMAEGGFVSQATEPGLADARLWRNPEMTELGLTLSRSLGHHGGRCVGLSGLPEGSGLLRLDGDDRVLILASDGLWAFVDPQEAVEVAWLAMGLDSQDTGAPSSAGSTHSGSTRRRGRNRGADGGDDDGPPGATRAARRLVMLAKERWREEQDDFRDDLAVVVVALPVTSTEADDAEAARRAAGTPKRAARRAAAAASSAADGEEEEEEGDPFPEGPGGAEGGSHPRGGPRRDEGDEKEERTRHEAKAE